MALVNIVSIGIKDITGGKSARKTIPIFFPAATALATIQTAITALIPALDAVVDGQITDASIQLALTVPGGIKTEPVDGNTVHEGANLRYGASGTDYQHGVYVPSTSNTDFTGDEWDNSGDMSTFTALLVSNGATDMNGNDLTAFNGGNRAFRK